MNGQIIFLCEYLLWISIFFFLKTTKRNIILLHDHHSWILKTNIFYIFPVCCTVYLSCLTCRNIYGSLKESLSISLKTHWYFAYFSCFLGICLQFEGIWYPRCSVSTRTYLHSRLFCKLTVHSTQQVLCTQTPGHRIRSFSQTSQVCTYVNYSRTGGDFTDLTLCWI